MSTPNPTYSTFIQASRSLRKATTITTRRKAALDLEQLLCNSTLRNKLKKEAVNIASKSTCSSSSNSSRATSANRVLRKVYRTLMDDAIHCAYQSINSKVKLKSEDIMLPRKVLLAIDSDSDQAIASLKREKNQKDWFYVTEPFSFESFHRYRNTNATLTYLSNKDIVSLLKYCLGCLQREELCNIAEIELLKLLHKLCSRSDYVSSFGTLNDLILEIIQELQPRIVPIISSSAASMAQKTFHSLIYILTAELGIDIQIFVRPCLCLIVDWVQHVKSNSNQREKSIWLYDMYSASVYIMASYPELCSSIFANDEKITKEVFEYALQSWNSARNIERDALVGYFSAYLLVCETAGFLQGMFPGDLGYIGKVSLNEEKVLKLCEMILSHASVKEEKSDARIRESKFNPLKKKERRYLELSARLLRCAQRFFLMRVERESSKNLREDLIEDSIKGNNAEDEFHRNPYDGLRSDRSIVSIESLARCPWVMFVMRSLNNNESVNVSIEGQRSSVLRSEYMNVSEKETHWQPKRLPTKPHLSSNPMIKAAKSCVEKYNRSSSTSHTQIKVYLQIICACAEVFPRGECWSSSNEWFQTNFCPFDCNIQCKMTTLSYCNACSCSDIAAVIHSVTDILSFGGDMNVHMWGLLCLLKLSECCIIAQKYWEKTDESKSSDEVPQAWRRVWDTILNHDLRFASYTSNASTSSLGEMVLMLLTEIVKGSLTSFKHELQLKYDKFLQMEQYKLWCLPVYKSASKIRTSAPFELMSQVLNSVGLAEGQDDAFMATTNNNIITDQTMISNFEDVERRFRIVSFCVDFIRINRSDVDLLRRVTPFIGTSLVCLVGNNCILTSITTYTMNSLRGFRVTETRNCVNENNPEPEHASLFNVLWTDVFKPFSFQFDVENNPLLWDKMDGRDPPLCLPWSMGERMNTTYYLKRNDIDPISTRKASELQFFALNLLLNAVGYGIHTVGDQDPIIATTVLPCKTIILKLILTIRLQNSYNDTTDALPWRCLEELFEAILRDVVICIKNPLSNKDGLIQILSDFVGIFGFLKRCYTCESRINQVRGLLGSTHIDQLQAECHGFVKEFIPTNSDYFITNQRSGSNQNHEHMSEGFENESEEDYNGDETFSGHIEDTSSVFSPSDPETDGLSDFDNEDDKLKKRKIKKQGGDKLKKHRSEESEDSKFMDTRLFWLSAHMLLLMDPSLEACNSIANSIIWPTEEKVYDCVEPNDCIICLSLFNKYVPLSIVDPTADSDTMSLFTLCTEIIFEGRLSAVPSSPYHLFGFHTCYHLIESQLRSGYELNFEEIDDLIYVLHPETVHSQEGKKALRSMKSFPFVRASRGYTAIKCFKAGSVAFHEKYDSRFQNSIVFESLSDQISCIRRMGIIGLGVALEYFPLNIQTQIVNDTLALLPVSECCPTLTTCSENYEQWVKRRFAETSNAIIGFQRQVWCESFSVVRSDTFHCISIIIGKVSVEEIVLRMISGLLSSYLTKYEYAILCLHCFETAASLRKFKSLEDLIYAHQFSLLKNWLNSSQTLLSLPITICSPALIRCFLRIGYSGDAQFKSFGHSLADDFVLQKASVIIPCVFIEANSEDSRDRYLKEVATVCVKGDVGKLLRSHIQYIYALALIMMHIKKGSTFPLREKAENIMSYLHKVPKVSQYCKKNSSYLIAMQILHIYGRNPKINDDCSSVSKASCLDAFEFFITKTRCIKKSADSVFHYAGSSTIECFLYARRLFAKSVYLDERKKAWRMMDFILDEVLRIQSSIQLGFCFKSLLSTLMYDRCEYIRCKILVKMKGILYKIYIEDNMSKEIYAEINTILNDIIVTMIHIHEDNQSRIVKFCLDSWYHLKENDLLQTKFKDMVSLSYNDGYDCWNNDDPAIAAITKCSDSVPIDLTRCSSLTFEVLELLFQQRDGLLKEEIPNIDPFPIQNVQYDDVLGRINHKFSLRALLLSFEEYLSANDCDNIVIAAKKFLGTVKRYITSKARTHDKKSMKDDIGIHSRILLSGIDRLRNRLLIASIDEELGFQEESHILGMVSKLVETLVMLCNHEYPQEIQVSAGSCLGVLTTVLHKTGFEANQIPCSERLTCFQDNAMHHFFANIFELLANYVYSSDTDLAIIAKDTFLSIVSTNDGNFFWFEGVLRDDLKTILMPFAKTKKKTFNVEQVQPGFLTKLKAWVPEANEDVNSWCWNEKCWECNSNSIVSYEDWIRNIVCSILICSYKGKKEDDVGPMIQGSSDFFLPCLFLCSREPEFAAAVFPAILFDLLSEGGGDYVAFAPPSSLSNQTITRCVTHLMKPIEATINEKGILSQSSSSYHATPQSPNFRALKAIVKFLDILRCVSEHRFYHRSHPINKMKIEGRTYDVNKGSVRIKNSSERYNDLPPCKIFRGRPYGVVLDLGDTVLATTLLKLKDYPLALIYAENYADNVLGGVGCAFELFATPQHSLSGFGNEIQPLNEVSNVERAFSFYDILKDCYCALNEHENLIGLEEQTSGLRFQNPEYFKSDRGNLGMINVGMKALLHADTTSQIYSGRGIPDIKSQLSVITCLDSLGLQDSLRHYLAGFSHNSVLNSSTSEQKMYIKEKWAETSWRLMQWDDTLLPQNLSRTIHGEKVNAPITFNDDFMSKAFGNSQTMEIGYHESMSKLFLSLISDDMAAFSTNLHQTKKCLLDEFTRVITTKLSSEIINTYHCLRLMTLNEIEDLASVIGGKNPPSAFIEKIGSSSNIFVAENNLSYSFEEIETAMACREICIKILFCKFGDHLHDGIGNSYVSHLQSSCIIARQHNHPNVATATLERMRRFIELTNTEEPDKITDLISSSKMRLEEARIMHCNGDTTAAVRTCKHLLSSIEDVKYNDIEDLVFLRGEATLQCGLWLVKHKIDAATIVLETFLSKAAEQAQEIHQKLKSDKSTKLLVSSHFALADFVANLYDSVETRVYSQEWKSLCAAAEGRKKELEAITKVIADNKKSSIKTAKATETNFLRIEQNKLKKEVEMDTKERKATEESISHYLKLAIKAYGVALSTCTGISNHSKNVYRLVSLWYRNSSGTGKGGDINALVASEVTSKIPSFHFVPLIYQIFSRIDTSIDVQEDNDPNSEAFNEEFQNVLKKLITRICVDHPYHGIVQIIALSNGHKVGGRNATTYLNNVGDSKVEASSKLLSLMERNDPDFLGHLIQSYKTVIAAYIDLAIAPTHQYAHDKNLKNIPIRDLVKENKSQSQPLDSCLRRGSNIKPCILTKIPAIRPGADYGDGVSSPPVGTEFIKSFQPHCSFTETGIHRPKIVICIGSNGGIFKQLVKGDDDIRQDAIMQQVFQTVNAMFRYQSTSKDKSSLLRSLMRLHTYNCIPLSPFNGILEWVDDTTSFGDYLYRSKDGKRVGAHEKYYPGEWDVSLCRSHYLCSPREERRASFDQICKNYSPCFRFFFLERFSHSPQRWHDARMSYIRSTAVNSIVGHILGIGDRHSNNILIHEKTGEVVHIDFGIVFEQGKVLPTPETVPFRLTRDVVDGFGPTGTNGQFTIAAQTTAEMLRENSNTLITVLSAVVADPLYSWSVSPVKARQREDDSIFAKENSEGNIGMPALAIMSENDNDAATRAIAKINEKLQGYEEGTFGEMQTVEGQVRLLINAARNRDNLCDLFVGWMPWL